MLKSLKTAAEIGKFRLRMAMALRDTPPRALASTDELAHLVALQTAYWVQRPPMAGAAAEQALHKLNKASSSAFVFSVRGQRVRLWQKPELLFPADEEMARHHEQQAFLRRAMLYQAFIAAVLRQNKVAYAIDFALDVNDMPEDSATLPIFSFQKMRGAHNLLLPDVDFFHSKWYRDDHDSLRYDEKTTSACFVGSSTGAWLTEESVRECATPRLRAAAYFHGNPTVIFRIANAVQCRSEEAKAQLMAQPYFSDYVGWADQLRHRFIISIDGNGAACSRLVKGLCSNSALVKFESPYELYYFAALIPNRDYLTVSCEADLEHIIACELQQPGRFSAVARSGQQFAEKYLTIKSVMAYTAALLGAFAALHRN